MPSSALRSSRTENSSRPPTSSRTEAGQVIPPMLDRIETANSLTEIAGVRIELIKRGTGRPLLLLHPAIGIKSTDRVIEELARSFTLIAPSHPGFGRSELPRAMTPVDDLAYFYLDVMEALDLREVVLAGLSFGGWDRKSTRLNFVDWP